MTKTKRIISLLLTLVMMLAVSVSMPLTVSAATTKAAKITLSRTSQTLTPGESITLTVKNGTGTVSWTTSDKTVAKVSAGKVTAVSTGTATITAKVDSQKLTCKITVQANRIKKSTSSIEVGKTVKLYLKGDTDGSAVKWTTSNSVTASVSSKGVVTGKRIGTVKITAKFGTKKLTTTIKVTPAVLDENDKIEDVTPAMLVSAIDLGWNLGNTLESNGLTWIQNPTAKDYETMWGNPVTTEKLFLTLKDAGINAVRLPVTWYEHVDDANGYKIDASWLKRVKEVVDYAYDNGFFVILNMHHEDTAWLSLLDSKQDKVEEKFAAIWKQIATEFKDYDYHLILEAMNEPRNVGGEAEWNGGTAETRANVNDLNALFVKTVRATGGSNKYRSLMCPTYSASSDAVVVDAYEVPDDERVIVDVHTYIPYQFALNKTGVARWKITASGSTKPISDFMERVYNKFVKNGTEVIIGEFGALNKDNLEYRTAWADYFMTTAESYGLPCFWWDNNGFKKSTASTGENFGLVDRTTYKWIFPELLEALLKPLGIG